MSAAAQLWIILARPDRLPGALIAREAVGDRFPGGIHLLREHSVWWERAQWDEYARRFTSVHAFPRVETARGIRDLPRLYRENVSRLQKMAGLPIESQHDAVLTLGGTVAIANAAISAHRRTFKILGIAQHMYDDLIRPIDRRRFRFTTSGWFQNRIVEPLAGVERTINLKPRFRGGGDGARISRLLRHPSQIYDVTIVFSNSRRDLSANSRERVWPALFPSISELNDRGRSPNDGAPNQRVVFFGTPFRLIHNLEPKIYIEQLNRCFDYLRQHYPEPYRLSYRPHPAETDEVKHVDLRRFEIEDDREAAELYFLQHFEEIEAVFSVSSTVSRVALNNGLNAYSFWRCFDFPATAAAFFESVMGEVPLAFDIRDLSAAPIKYADQFAQPESSERFGSVLNRALDLRLRR